MSVITAERLASEDSALPAAIPRREQLAVWLDPSPFDERRRFGLQALFDLLGIRISFACESAPEVYCGLDPRIGSQAAIWITPEPRVEFADEYPVLVQRLPPESLIRGNKVRFDMALSAHYWLSLESEKELARDEHGRVPGTFHPAQTHDGHQPSLHRYAEVLAEQLRSCGWNHNVPRWPHNKKWAIAFTHDVDDPERDLGLVELLRRATRRSQSLKEAYWSTLEHFDWTSLRQQILKPERRTEWDFAEFLREEQAGGIRSAFYFGVNQPGLNHPLDVKYDISLPRYPKLFKSLVKLGCEVGLHAAYDTSRGRQPISEQLNQLDDKCSSPVSGVRYHYLQLHALDPMCTLSETADSGLRYDTTIGFNDMPGFRAGIAAPYLPPCRPKSHQPFVELPMTLADMHLPPKDEAEAARIVIEHLETVRSIGGLAVLNWHIGHWHSDSGWRAGYRAACSFVAEDAQVWKATPAQIADWWVQRAHALKQGGPSRFEEANFRDRY